MFSPSIRTLSVPVAAVALALGIAGVALPAAASPDVAMRVIGNDVSLRAIGNVSAIGWQPVAGVAIPDGQSSIFLHYNCPAGTVADAGAFDFNQQGYTNVVNLTFNGPRIDESPAYFGEWGWSFSWPGGAPYGLTGNFDVHCVKK